MLRCFVGEFDRVVFFFWLFLVFLWFLLDGLGVFLNYLLIVELFFNECF